MMAWLKLVGMIPSEAGSYWSAGTLEVWPADRSRLDWADGGRRAAFPITGNLAGGGTRWGSTNEAGDVYIPGADIGNSVNPPVLDITARLRDGVTGEWKEFRGTGRVQASAPGEWNINAPLGGALQYVNTPGVPAGALLQTDVGVAVPSMGQFGGHEGRLTQVEGRITPLADNTITSADGPNAFPLGVTLTTRTDGNGAFPTNAGTLLTKRPANPDGISQEWTEWQSTNRWIRRYAASGDAVGWGPWLRVPQLVEAAQPAPGLWVRRYDTGEQEIDFNLVLQPSGGGGEVGINFNGYNFVDDRYAASAMNGDFVASGGRALSFDIYTMRADFLTFVIRYGGTNEPRPNGANTRVIGMVRGRWK